MRTPPRVAHKSNEAISTGMMEEEVEEGAEEEAEEEAEKEEAEDAEEEE